MIHAHARGLTRLLRSDPVACLWLLGSAVMCAMLLVFVAASWSLGWRWTTLMVIVAAAQLHLLRYRLETPRLSERTVLPVRAFPRVVMDATLPWAIASLLTALALLVFPWPAALQVDGVSQLDRALGLVALCFPFVVSVHAGHRANRNTGRLLLLTPSLILVVAVATGWTDTLLGELSCAAVLLAAVVVTYHREDPAWLRGSSGRRHGAHHRPALPATQRLRADLLRSATSFALPAALTSAACFLTMGALGVEPGQGSASFVLMLTAQLAQMAALAWWPWLPPPARPGAGELDRLPLRRTSIERAAIAYFLVGSILLIAANTTAVGLLALGLERNPGAVLKDITLLAPILPAMGWLALFVWRFHAERHHLVTYSIAAMVFWFAWLLAGGKIMSWLPQLLAPEGASLMAQTFAVGVAQLVLVAIFLGAVLLLRLTWLRPTGRST